MGVGLQEPALWRESNDCKKYTDGSGPTISVELNERLYPPTGLTNSMNIQNRVDAGRLTEIVFYYISVYEKI